MVVRRVATVLTSFYPNSPELLALQREKNLEEKCKSSVVAQFNRAQLEKGWPTCSYTTARELHTRKVALHPSMTDYCDTSKYLKEHLSRNQAIHNRMQQSGGVSAVEMRATESARQT